MTCEQTNDAAAVYVTEAERARLALADEYLSFAAENLPKLTDEESLPGTPAEWEDPKSSLLGHVGIRKTIRTVASTIAVHNYYQLRRFEYCYPDTFLAELRSDAAACQDAKRRARIESAEKAFLTRRAYLPGVHGELANDVETTRSNVAFALKTLVGYARYIVAGWIETIPAIACKEFLAELDRLESADIKTQMRFFGLGDLMEGK